MGVCMNNLGCFSTNIVMNLEFIMVQIYVNASDYYLKLHVSKLPKLLYTTIDLLEHPQLAHQLLTVMALWPCTILDLPQCAMQTSCHLVVFAT